MSDEEETKPDAKSFRRVFRKDPKRSGQDDTPDSAAIADLPGVAPSPGSGKDAECYHMGHARRGVALLLNHDQIGGMAARKGTGKDCKDLTQALEDLDFDVQVHQDLAYKDIKVCLRELAAADHSDADCLVVAAMTHGDPDILYARDRPYMVKELWEQFTPDKCVTLAGKPKIFFIQACRGNKVDDGVLVKDTLVTDSPDGYVTGYTLPLQADILVAYSTVEGYYSWRNPINGSWFVQSLCKELRVNGTSRDLLTLLTFVCRRVAVGYQSAVPGDYDMDRKKQVPTITSTLTRLVHFPARNKHPTTSPGRRSHNTFTDNQRS